jgi:hypothetical protein
VSDNPTPCLRQHDANKDGQLQYPEFVTLYNAVCRAMSKPTPAQLSDAAHAMLDGMWVSEGASKGIDEGVAQGCVEDIKGSNGLSLLGGRVELTFHVICSNTFN